MATEVEERELTETEALVVVREYHAARLDEAKAKRRKDGAGGHLKRFLEDEEGNRTLFDAEWSLDASIETRTGTPTYDVRKIPAELVLWLARQGNLKVNHDAVMKVAECTEKDALKKFKMPGKPTTALIVKRRED